MTLTLERPLTTERPRTGSPSPSYAAAPPRPTGPDKVPSRPRRRWLALAALLVAGLLVALLVSAESAEPGPEGTTVELEPVDKAEPNASTPTNTSTDDASGPAWWPFETGDETTPACGGVPWRLPCPEKATP